MKIFYLTKNNNLGDLLGQSTEFQYQVIALKDEHELFDHDFEKCVLVIDLDTFMDHGFSLAVKLSNQPEKKALIIGVTTLEVDATDSKFDFFFDSIESVNKNFEAIVERYEEI